MSVCTIKILDEVNCHLTNLDVATRRKCVNKLKFKLPYSYNLPSVRLGKWDGCISYFSVGGQTQINLLDRILPIIEEAGYFIEIEDHRATYDFNFKHIDENIISNRKWPDSHSTDAGNSIILKEHQVSVINNLLDNLQSIAPVATGAGKTIIVSVLSKIMEKYGRTIVIVPSKQLVEQTLKDYLMLGLDAGVYYGDEKNWNKTHTICTWQSLDRLLKKTKDGETEQDKDIQSFIKGVIAVIVDECHGVSANSLQKILTRVLGNVPIRWGLTGTIPKQDYEIASLLSAVGPIINGVSSAELQEIGVLSNCQIEIIQAQENIKFKDYPSEIDYLTTNPKRLRWMAGFIEAISESGNTLVLVNRIETGKELERLIPDSVFVSGNVKVKDRNEEYDLIATEDNRVIIATYGVAAVGINIPRLYNIVMLEPGKSFVRTIQSIGRVLRRALDKDFATIYDLCSSTKYSKKHLCERKKYYKESSYPYNVNKTTID